MGLKSSLWSAMPFAAMVMVECGSIGLTTLSKAAMRRGMSNFVFILYSYILATLLLLPFLFICRSCISQILQYEGIRSSSPILNSATDNILPAFIFILAIIFRMEPLALKSSYGRAKLLGTLVSITGAFVVTLYKGPSIFISNSSASNLAHQRFLLSPKSNWVFGGFLLSLHILALAFLFIIQASIVKDYQAEFSITFFYCFFGSIPTAFISVIAEKDPSAWILRPNLELIAIIYSKENTKRLMEEVKFSSQTTPSHQRFNVAGLPLLLVSIASHTFAVRNTCSYLCMYAREERKAEMGLKSSLWSAMPFAAMVTVECAMIGLSTLSKAAMRRGMSNFVFILYSYILATLLLLLPSVFVICRHRATHAAPLTFSILCKIFLLGLAGCTAQILQFEGIRSSSPTLSSAVDNTLPAFVFILALIFRMERLSLKSSYGQAKLLGTLVSVTGAFVVTFYRGPSIIRTSSTSNSSDHHHHQQLLLFPKSSWVFGGFLLSLHTLVVAFLHIIQASIVNDYQAEFPIAFFYCFFASIQTTLISLVAERDPSAWRLRPNLELIAIIYAAIFGCAIRSLVNLWCLGKNGPVYVAMFKPFGIVIAVVTSSTFLRDSLYLGSVVGSAIISVGFYAVMWGKAKEWKIAKDIEEYSLMSTTERVPLL
ncbi:PREDICTED: WAT1-related protein At4g15540-like isoform X2 [Nelumbo nucifera]|uniref:WAT1-related protein At4g15540-like isoform X2 n=1 Tax=Nelumbo nucifera TaxID=4432 RepID=A0A1U8Q4X6_NELNU|nr:PREDICTED: WAT1-related protein At4g15540-like isoform X2 [Nelumbo nucifera]